MQGDIYRAKLKERERFGDRPEISRILTGVDDMSITDPYLTKDFEYDNRIDYNEPVGTDYSRVRCPIAFCDLHLSLFSFPKKYTSYINAVSNRPAAAMTQDCDLCIFYLSQVYDTSHRQVLTQGDRLNQLKVQRRHARSAVVGSSS